jgi:hypothetical protein
MQTIADYVESLLKLHDTRTSQLEEAVPFMAAAVESKATSSSESHKKNVETFIKLRLALVDRFIKLNCPYEASYHFRCSVVLIINQTGEAKTIPGIFAESAKSLRTTRIGHMRLYTDKPDIEDMKLFEDYVETMQMFEAGVQKLLVEGSPGAAEPLFIAAYSRFFCPKSVIVQGASAWMCRAYLTMCGLIMLQTADTATATSRNLVNAHNILLQSKNVLEYQNRWSGLLESCMDQCEVRMVDMLLLCGD